MILISNDFCHKIKMYNFDSYNVLLAIATNIPVLLMTAFVLQGHVLRTVSLNALNNMLPHSEQHMKGQIYKLNQS